MNLHISCAANEPLQSCASQSPVVCCYH